jgi:hypothetical protein
MEIDGMGQLIGCQVFEVEFDRIVYPDSEQWARDESIKGHIGIGGPVG